MSKYSKTLVALAAFVALLGQALANGSIDAAEGGALLTALVGVAAVFAVRNRPADPTDTSGGTFDRRFTDG